MTETRPLEALGLAPGAARPRRLRRTPALRDLVRETTLGPDDLVLPLFVVPGEGVRRPVPPMPGVEQLSCDALPEEASELAELGLKAVLLFGIPSTKDALGLESFAEDGVVQQAIRTLKDASPELVVVTDVCLCEYTDHGHCGVLDADGYLLNDETLELLARIAVSHAEAGADVVAPSGMIDGMVGVIRAALDGAGHERVGGAVVCGQVRIRPLRPVPGGSRGSTGVRRPEEPPARPGQRARGDARGGARRRAGDGCLAGEARTRIPGRSSRRTRALPGASLAAYNVSGEYAMVKAAAANGWLDERAVVLEILTGIRRAGADLVVTYHAKDAARWIQ